MEIGGWAYQNWFDLLSAVGIVASLWFTAISLRSETKTRQIANLLTITANHREIWKEFSHNPELKRVLDASADPVKQPVTDLEEMFVMLVIHHVNSVYYAMSGQLVVLYEGLRQDVAEFISLPIPKAVWHKAKPLQNRDFVAFVESTLKQ